ncbi:MAG: hypothetical protein IKJ63_03575 [Clostridia bacterium]|nr:hypothetical protein [Clostridia bacterium]
MAMQNEIKEYIKSVKKQIVCPTAESRQMLRELQANVSDFVQENPDADMVQIVEQFGEPEEIAKNYLADADPKRISKAINNRKVIIAVGITIVIVFAIFLLCTFVESYRQGHGTVTIDIETGTTILMIAIKLFN